MKSLRSHKLRSRQQGGILVTTILIIVLMSMLAAATLYRVSSRYATTYHSMCWNEALTSAESGADLALMVLNNSLKNPSTAWAGWSPSDEGTFPKTYMMSVSDHAGQGNTKVFARIVVDKDIGGGWMRVRSTGVAELPSRSVNGLESAPRDASGVKNHNSALRKPRFYSDITGGRLRLPQVSRTVEAIANPAVSFPYRRPLTVKGSISMTGGAWTDSFDSSKPAYSTNSFYDFSKHLNNGDIATNSSGSLSDLKDSFVYGDATSNGGLIKGTTNVKGEVTNNFQTTIGNITAPAWPRIEMTPTSVNNPSSSITLVGGTAESPKNYKLSQIAISSSNGIILAPSAPGVVSYINIWVTGKVSLTGNAYILQEPGVYVTIFGEDDMKFSGNGYLNKNAVASTLQIFGVTSSSGTSRSLQVSGNGNFTGVLNAPSYDLTISGNGSFVGTAIGKTATISGNGGFHYDEALGALPAPSASSYQYVCWMEDIR